MWVSLEEMKAYLRVDFDDDNTLINTFLLSAEKMCKSIIRIEENKALENYREVFKVAIMYAVAYLYEHREDANHQQLSLTLRALLASGRKDIF